MNSRVLLSYCLGSFFDLGTDAMSELIDPSIAQQFERLPPHSIDAEMALLASMMLDKALIGDVVQIVDREAFFQVDHQIIFDVLVKLFELNRPIDPLIVREELLKRQLLEEVGGVGYIGDCSTPCPPPRMVPTMPRSSGKKPRSGNSFPPATRFCAMHTPPREGGSRSR